jgi:transcriptional regulator with XRE-family HTH domain
LGSTATLRATAEHPHQAAMLDLGGSDRRVSTGLTTLDDVLGGLYWGDNVVWQLDGASAEPFYRAILRFAHEFDATSWIAVGRDPGPIAADFTGLEVVGTTPGQPSIEPGDLLREIRRRCDAGKRNLLLFESLDGMVAAWGAELTRGFFARCCPLLLEVGAIAYWSMDLRRMPATIRDTVEAVTQCVLRLDKHSVRVAKAEGRDQSVRGSLLHWHPGTDGPVLSEAEVTGRVAASLRALRRSRKISQRQLAQLAGVTASAISQAERAERGLSLSTLVRLSAKLGLTVDDLLHGEDPSTYRIGRRVGDPHGGPERAITLLGGITSDLRIDLVHLGPREAGSPIERQEGEGIVAVSRGLVQVQVGDQTPAIRDGEVLLAECSRIDGWRNLGDRDAALFWIVVAHRS